ncbi:hypothetical protein P261_00364 [Lachnospiraceae bacterium TWA4]|nr:hypothetical protein P261_00364 [Lachnospiraceae bacterium TWA4]
MKIICPYCFEEMEDDDVHFRSEKVSPEECESIPEDFEDIEDFKTRYRGGDKESILKKIEDWEYFCLVDDKIYKRFWNNFGKETTEYDPAEKREPYRRRILIPDELIKEQRYIKNKRAIHILLEMLVVWYKQYS